jgi:hypothetical protein
MDTLDDFKAAIAKEKSKTIRRHKELRITHLANRSTPSLVFAHVLLMGAVRYVLTAASAGGEKCAMMDGQSSRWSPREVVAFNRHSRRKSFLLFAICSRPVKQLFVKEERQNIIHQSVRESVAFRNLKLIDIITNA